MSIPIPRGFRLAGVHCGIKLDPQKPDLALVVSDVPAAAAGVYTQNLVSAAPVVLDRQRTPGDGIRVVVINSGNANACTGSRGLRDAAEMARLAAGACGEAEEQALVLSTGIIGKYLPMDRIARGIEAAAARLADDEEALMAAASGMMTTDVCRKLAGRTLSFDGADVRITGMAKGAGMIGPNMATLLAVVMTDAGLTPKQAQSLLQAAADDSFNCISVEGHTSTNDTLLLLANGQSAAGPLEGGHRGERRGRLDQFSVALGEVCRELARAIPADGEGATHLITIEVTGCADRAGAVKIAKTVAHSALVKTAVAGADPNWGRIVSAAGYAGVPFDPARLSLRLNGFLLYHEGAPVEFDAAAVSDSIRENQETHIVLQLAEGDGEGRHWTSDLTAEYVRINADYHT